MDAVILHRAPRCGRRSGNEEGRPAGRPSRNSCANQQNAYFLLHFWVAEALRLSPLYQEVVSLVVHDFALQRAIT
jgi:hypothetical protein